MAVIQNLDLQKHSCFWRSWFLSLGSRTDSRVTSTAISC